jgi:hypothetical protein
MIERNGDQDDGTGFSSDGKWEKSTLTPTLIGKDTFYMHTKTHSRFSRLPAWLAHPSPTRGPCVFSTRVKEEQQQAPFGFLCRI